MPSNGQYEENRYYKVWRYPGVPIPDRLKFTYRDFSIAKGNK
jgi:hypothetical protein